MSVKVSATPSYSGFVQEIDQAVVAINKYVTDPCPSLDGSRDPLASAKGRLYGLRDHATAFTSFLSWRVNELVERALLTLGWHDKEEGQRRSKEIVDSLLELRKKVEEEEAASAHSDPSLREQVEKLTQQVKDLASEVLKVKDTIRDLKEKALERRSATGTGSC